MENEDDHSTSSLTLLALRFRKKMNTQSIYMHWAKTRPKVKYDLALSGILNLPFPELEAKIEDIDLNGDNSYGYGPLVDALASHCDVVSESVVTISGGTSMANHLAMAAAVEHGDEVLIEQPTYKPLLALAEYFGAQVKRFARSFENGFRVDLEDFASKITSRTRLIVLTNLHNPSSTLIDEETLRRIGEIAQSVGARSKLPRFMARAKRILENNRVVLNDFLDSRENLKVVRTDSGTTSFPQLLKGRVEDLCALLGEKYDTAVVPGRFFESPQHFRIGMCAEPQLFSEGVRRLGAALDELRA